MVPVLLLILLLALDFGRLFLGWVNLQNTARIAANYAAGHPLAWSTPIQSQKDAYARQIADDARTINCTLQSPPPDPSFPDGSRLNGRAVVNISCQFQLLTPFASAIFPNNRISLGAGAVFPIRGGLAQAVPGLTPAPSSSDVPTPLPSGLCTVPPLIGTSSDDAEAAWIAAGFLPDSSGKYLLTIAFGSYTINFEDPPYVDGTAQSCSGFQLSVGP